jgi:hypothetical protein
VIEREPIRPRDTQIRYLLVTPQIDALLDGHVLLGVFPTTEAERLIGIYAAGHFVTVSRKVTKQRPDMEQLEGFDEVWAICPRRPPPGWRILGRFYDKGVFVGLRAWDKHHLSQHYPQAAAEVIDDWQDLFGAQAPLRSDDLSDYLGEGYRDVDQDA